jgi:hypothetical protein
LPLLRQEGWRLEVDPETVSPEAAVIVTSASYAARESDAIRGARAQGIPSAQLVDSWYDYRRRVELTDGADVWPDEIWLLDDDARREAVGEGLPDERLRVVGNPTWENVAVLPAAPASNILLVDQPIEADMGRRLGFDENDFFQMIGDWFRGQESGGVKLCLAPHPRRLGPLPNWGGQVEVVRDARQALRLCGTVIGMFSSLLIDAFLAGRRVVSVQPGAGSMDYCVLSRLGLVPKVEQAAALPAALDNSRPGPQGFDARFGNSRERVVTALTELSNRRR